MKITKHGQSCFLIEAKGVKVLVDPGSYLFIEEGQVPESFYDLNAIVITHDHFDHFDWEKIQKILSNSAPVVFSTLIVYNTIKDKFPHLEVIVTNSISEYDLGGVSITGFPSQHGPLPNGVTPPEVCGVVIDDGDNRFYTPGDSIFLESKAAPTVAAVPICGQVVMNIDQAKKETIKLNPKIAIPIHYDNAFYPADPHQYEDAMRGSDVKVKILSWGESIEV